LKLDDDDFAIFGFDRRFAIDAAALESQRKTLQAEVHPDKFVSQGASAQRLAVQWSVRVNEGYQRLKSPVSRAAYLCQLAGIDLAVERNTAMPTDFLMRQMAWREALEEAGDAPAVEALAQAVRADRRTMIEQVQHTLDEAQDPAAAAHQVRALMFVDRFLEDIDRRLEALDP
jgi:molecular chaperone HscB